MAVPDLVAEWAAEVEGAPAGVPAVAPATAEDLSSILRLASESGLRVLVWGGGTHQGMGYRMDADLVVSTALLTGITAWEPEDLTVVVGAGTAVADVEAELRAGDQSAVLPEHPGTATVGGVVASGASGYRRGRFGATRDRLLEVRAVTGDGRLVKGGARVVKNVSGYDLPRLYAGSFGSLGVITEVCLKLWPLTQAEATVEIEHADAATSVYRPLAVLETPERCLVYLAGTNSEVEDQVVRLAGTPTAGHDWPVPPDGPFRWSLRLPPAALPEALGRLPAGWDYVAEHGVGIVAAASAGLDGATELRCWAEGAGGALVVTAAPDEGYVSFDPWGSPPAALELQRRVIAAFDPARILGPGRLPGRL